MPISTSSSTESLHADQQTSSGHRRGMGERPQLFCGPARDVGVGWPRYLRRSSPLRIGDWLCWATPTPSFGAPHTSRRVDLNVASTYHMYMPNKTISVPDDVVPIIDGLGVPFSTWVAEQLRRHAATLPGLSLGQQLLADAVLAATEPPTDEESLAVLERMERSAPW